MPQLRIATFSADVTPPVGHPLCAGWMLPAVAVTDSLYALGIVLMGDGDPVVLCALDWCEISNRSHIKWRKTLAAAAGTSADRVAVQCMHPHCTPWPDDEAQQLVSEQAGIRPIMDPEWCDAAIDRVAKAIAEAVPGAKLCGHLEIGRAKVKEVASNRRVLGPDGKIKAVRWTVTRDPAVRAEPEGLIDPWLKTISFWGENRKLAALHYYAVHPTSYDSDSRITSDFTGLARNRRTEQEGVPHIYFTECAGNITAGKYNDGAPENRSVFTEHIYQAIVASERSTERLPFTSYDWLTLPVQLPPLVNDEAQLVATLNDPIAALSAEEKAARATTEKVTEDDEARSSKERCRAAMQISYLHRYEMPIPFTRLRLAERVSIVHLPGEPFIEYQLFAQQARPDQFVAVAGYGDCGVGYVCLEDSFAQGGYEPTDSFVAGESENIMKDAIAKLME